MGGAEAFFTTPDPLAVMSDLVGTYVAFPILMQKICPHTLQTIALWTPLRSKDLYTDSKVCPPENGPRELVGAGYLESS